MLKGDDSVCEPNTEKEAPTMFVKVNWKEPSFDTETDFRLGGTPITLALLDANTVSEAYFASIACAPALRLVVKYVATTFVLSGT